MPVSFNISRTFTVNKEDLSLVKNTAIASDYWKNITASSNNSFVSISITWAEAHGLNGSGQKTGPGKSVFQVHMFHQLHCLVRLPLVPAAEQAKQSLDRIRQDIIGAKYLFQLNPNRTEDHPYSKHTLHWINYLRQAIMCASDMTVVSTGDDLEFDDSPPRMCRDFEAMGKWVERNAWDYGKYLNDIS